MLNVYNTVTFINQSLTLLPESLYTWLQTQPTFSWCNVEGTDIIPTHIYCYRNKYAFYMKLIEKGEISRKNVNIRTEEREAASKA